MKICVTGAGGMIAGHLVKKLLADGHEVRAVDSKPFLEWYQKFDTAENLVLNLRGPLACKTAVSGADQIYNLAASMGGIGFIQEYKAECMLNVLINTNLLIAARDLGIKKYFFSSSACVYSEDKQNDYDAKPLKETDAYPATPEDGYGWEKLFSERMCRHFKEDYGVDAVVARYHNVYGTHGTYQGGREKAPAAICRKVIEAQLSGTNEIEIWGDGNQTRSFMWVGDCVKGSQLLMEYGGVMPVNLGSTELVSINKLVDIVEEISGTALWRKYNTKAPKGVNGRNSDNSLLKAIVAWEPSTDLRYGMEILYGWIREQMLK